MVSIDGGSGGAVLNLFDDASSSDENYTLTSSTLDRLGPGMVTFRNLASIHLDAGTGSDTITVQSTPAGTSVAIHGGGADTLVGSADDNTWVITGSNSGTLRSPSIAGLVAFSSFQNLIGGALANTFIFSDGAGISGNLDGGGGGGSLDYSAYSSSVIVDLQTDSATGVGGSIANIQNQGRAVARPHHGHKQRRRQHTDRRTGAESLLRQLE
jgi:hypothetical protein